MAVTSVPKNCNMRRNIGSPGQHSGKILLLSLENIFVDMNMQMYVNAGIRFGVESVRGIHHCR
jgi:hypothetical protein